MRNSAVFLVGWINFLVNTAIQGPLMFIPILGARLGASDFQVGLIGAAYGGAYLASSLYCGRQSDRRGRLVFIRTGLFLCSITFASQIFAYNLLTLAAARAGVGLALGITMAALVAYASDSGADMGRYSSMGSLGWIAGSLAAAALIVFSRLFAVSAIFCAAAFCLSLFFPHDRIKTGREKEKPPGISWVIRAGLPVYAAIFFRHLGASSVWIILPLYLTSAGISQSWIGLLYGLNFAVQFFVMRQLERFNPRHVFTVGQVLSILVFLAYIFAENLLALVLAQVLLGVAWSCLYVGALLLVLDTGENKGTASGIFQSTLNLCGVIGPFLGGAIAQVWGYHGVLIFAAALGVAGLVTAAPRVRLQQKN